MDYPKKRPVCYISTPSSLQVTMNKVTALDQSLKKAVKTCDEASITLSWEGQGQHVICEKPNCHGTRAATKIWALLRAPMQIEHQRCSKTNNL
jgi:hypothetical protein